ncbi:MAG: AMP-binding protein [Myxococcota bacterium]|nr:AMP-binding protein [Myxococcota bacterium]
MTTHSTLTGYLDQWAEGTPTKVWLRDLNGDDVTEWTWKQAHEEIQAAAAWLEQNYPQRTRMAILSRNRAHWVLADYAIIAAGNVTIPIFTTLPRNTAEYVLEFSETKVLFVGETENWDEVREVLPADVQVITFPGVSAPDAKNWVDIVAEASGQSPSYECKSDDLISLVFTSGTTGVPKGVMQTHDSFVIPIERFQEPFGVRPDPRYLSYLPLSHIAERQLVEGSSLLTNGVITFNEGLPNIFRDLQAVRPNFFFGPPRVWEQLQQFVTAQFGSQDEIDKALAENRDAAGKKVLEMLGLTDVDYCLTAAAPTPPALIEWFQEFGLTLMEGFGQTEAMGLIANSHTERRIGSIGKVVRGVEYKISEQDELIVKATGLSPGYYKMPDKTAETFVEGWIHTGDKARVDADGFLYLTGRVKDYFKTIQGKFVAPTPIENIFSENVHTEQQCLLGRGYSKTAMTCVLSALAQEGNREAIETELLDCIEAINGQVEHHARIGALIISNEPWTIANEILTPTMKIRREQIEAKFGELAQKLAHAAAVEGKIRIHWDH